MKWAMMAKNDAVFNFRFLKCLICNRKRTEWSPIWSVIVHLTHYLICDWPKACSEISKAALGTSSKLDVTGNHVMYDRGV